MLVAVQRDGGARFCHRDEEPKVRYGMLRIVRARRCDMAQAMLRANAIIFFLCTLVCGVLIGLALWRKSRGTLRDQSKDASSSESSRVDLVEVVEVVEVVKVRANKR